MVRVPSAGLLLIAGVLCGCGTQNNPCVEGMDFRVVPAAGTASHLSAAPGNQVKFTATSQPYVISGSGCALPQIVASVQATWTTSDAKNVSISSAAGATNGLATCLGATSGAVTITATNTLNMPKTTPTMATATLTCQ